MTKARDKRVAAQRAAEDAWRKDRRQEAAAAWGQDDAPTRQRTAMVIAAFLLDEAHDPELADWLLCARPEHAREVATGVAVHALLRGFLAVWDALAAVDAMDVGQAGEWYDDGTENDFVWSPEPEWLVTAAIKMAREALR